jgi:hypothetical protein
MTLINGNVFKTSGLLAIGETSGMDCHFRIVWHYALKIKAKEIGEMTHV